MAVQNKSTSLGRAVKQYWEISVIWNNPKAAKVNMTTEYALNVLTYIIAANKGLPLERRAKELQQAIIYKQSDTANLKVSH